MPVLFIDFDGTLCLDRFWSLLPATEYQLIQGFLFQDRKELADEWMRGKYTSEEINRLVSEHLNIPYDRLWDAFEEGVRGMRVSSRTLDAINSLRHKFHTVLLTGNMDCFDRFTRPSLGLDAYFDDIGNSYTHGMLKHENGGVIFQRYCALYGPIESSYLIDDSDKACSVFEALGGTAYRVGNPQEVDQYLDQLAGE